MQLTRILGIGAYGVVYSAHDITANVQYAVKCLSKLNGDVTLLGSEQLALQTSEIDLHYSASAHPNVVSLLGVIDSTECVYVILKYCPEGDLFTTSRSVAGTYVRMIKPKEYFFRSWKL